MVTGIETAGLVLGSLPLVISALEHYAEGISTIIKWWHFKKEILCLVRSLEAEQARFLNTCELLLEGLVPAQDLEKLIQNAGGEQWKDDELDAKLRRRLHRSHMPYLNSVTGMQEALEEIKTKLELNAEGKPLWTDYRSFRHEYKRIKFSLSRKSHEDLVGKIARGNDMLANLTSQNLTLEPSRQRRQRPATPFRAIQEHARNLYNVISQSWNCGCTFPHSADLCLDPRVHNSDLNNPETQITSASRLHFKVIFSVDTNGMKPLSWAWRETEIRLLDPQSTPTDPQLQTNTTAPLLPPTRSCQMAYQGTSVSVHTSMAHPTLSHPEEKASKLNLHLSSKSNRPKKSVKFESPPSPPHTPFDGLIVSLPKFTDPGPTPIENLCRAIKQCTDIEAYDRCLGYLCTQAKQRLAVYLPGMSTTVPSQRNLASLSQLMNQGSTFQNQAIPKGKFDFSRGDRLRLALTIASSVLQLYKTPWLRDDWTKDDIMINDGMTRRLHDQAYVSRSFPATPELTGHEKKFLGPRNKTLFALGVVLIELSLGSTIETLRDPDDPLGPDGVPNIHTTWYTANRLIDEVYDENGKRYGDAVRRCINCDFDMKSTTLDDEAFSQAVYNGVVAQLEDDVKDFF